jgi:hypothetical protein
MDYSQILCTHFGLPDSFEHTIRHKPLTNQIVDLLLYTRKRNHIITFQELFSIAPYDLEDVLCTLSSRSDYIEARYDHLINGCLLELGLSYRESCVTKALFNAWNDFDCPFVNMCACLFITYELLNKPKPVEFVLNVLKKKHTRINKNKVVKKVSEMKTKGFKNIVTNNKYAQKILCYI